MIKQFFKFVIVTLSLIFSISQAVGASNDTNFKIEEVNQRLEKLEDMLQSAKERQDILSFRLEKAILTGNNTFRFSSFMVDNENEEITVDFDGYPIWFDPIQSNKLLNGTKANNSCQIDIIGRTSDNYELSAQLKTKTIWPSRDGIISPGPIFVKANMPNNKVIIGQFTTLMTPLTLYYYNDPGSKFEGALWQQLRSLRSKELGLSDNERQFQGVKIEHKGLGYTLVPLLTALRIKNDGYPYTRYLFGLQSHYEVSPKNTIGMSSLHIIDDLHTGHANDQPKSNLVISIDYSGRLTPNFDLQLEVAKSQFNNDYTQMFYIEGTASRFSLKSKANGLALGFDSSYVSPNYYCPSAQSQDLALATDGRFGIDIFLPLMGASNNTLNELSPFGIATPNRKKFICSVQLDYKYGKLGYQKIKGSELVPMDDLEDLDVEHGSLRSFSGENCGLELNIGAIVTKFAPHFSWPMTFSIYYESKDVKRDDDPQTIINEAIFLKQNTISGGFEIAVSPNSHFLLAYKGKDDKSLKALGWRYRLNSRCELFLLGEEITFNSYRGKTIKAYSDIKF